MSNYSIDEHIHRYACWTAARAASTSRFSNTEVADFINTSGLKESLQSLRSKTQIDHYVYKEWYIRQVNCILQSLEEYTNPKDKKRKKLFGIAAKIVSIYVKTAEVLPSKGSSSISRFAFPPIDRFLLTGLKRELRLKNISWSNMEEEEYMNLIETLKTFIKDKPFWKLEYYWELNKASKTKFLKPIL